MNKLYSLIIFLMLGSSVNAQSYRPMFDSLNFWYYTSTLLPVSQQERPLSGTPCTWPLWGMNMHYLTDGDTVINSVNYLRLYSDYNGTGVLCHQGYVREDTAAKTVYYMEPQLSPERLLYDFSMQPGDSIYVNAGGSFNYFQTGYYYLDSISPFQMISGVTNAYYLRNPNSPPFAPLLIWLEGVGFPGEVIYDMPAMNLGGGFFSSCHTQQAAWYGYEKILTCFSHQQKVYFDSCAWDFAQLSGCFNIQDSCNYYNICGSVSELSSVSSFKLQPNPADLQTQLLIEADKTEEIQIDVLDITGKIVASPILYKMIKGSQEVTLNVAGISPGIYLVRLSGKEGSVNSRLVKL